MMKKNLSAFPLKAIAIISMLINHIALSGLIGYEDSPVFYAIALAVGKLTFPIMAYLLIEGYRYTRNKRKYAVRLFLFNLLSVVPFYLAFYYPNPFTVTELVNNVMFTLFMGLVLLMSLERVQSGGMRMLLVLACCMITLFSDWPVIGVLLIYGFYHVEGEKARIVKPVLYMMLFMIALLAVGFLATNGEGYDTGLYMTEFIGALGLLLPIPVLLKYNGERGYSPGWVKWGFYLFYPAHLLILGLITM